MRKNIIFSALLAMAAIGLGACSSDNDIAEPEQPVTDGVVRTPITITADYGDADGGTTRTTYRESGNTISAKWQTGDQILVVFDGHVNTLELASGAGTTAATFSGTIIGTPTAQSLLSCYVRDANNPSALTVSGNDIIYSDAAFLSQDGTLAGAAKCNIHTGSTTYGDGTDLRVVFTANTSMMKFTVDASGLTSGEATLSYQTDGTTLASATFAVASNGKNTVYMTVPVGIYTGAQTLHYVSATNSIDETATLSDTQANFAAGQTYSKTIVVLNSATGSVSVPNGAIVSGTGGSGTHLTIAADATVKLDGASFNTNGKHEGITCAGNATVNLRGTNSVQASANYYPGIYVPEGSKLTIGGSGSLTAKGATNAAGIGSGYLASCGNIFIKGGTVTAYGGLDAAGIGSGYHSSCGNINIYGGSTVTATGGENAAGIGSGYLASCGNIEIYGDSNVTATGGENAAGIGSGYGDGASCGTINIGGSATHVTAKGGVRGAGIGSGNYASSSPGKYIRINGGTVTATGGIYAAGIGSGSNSSCGFIEISDGTITATGGIYAAGIGSGEYSSCNYITISGGSITATKGNDYAASIGKGDGCTSCGTIKIGGTTYWDGSYYQNGGATYLSTSPFIWPTH